MTNINLPWSLLLLSFLLSNLVCAQGAVTQGHDSRPLSVVEVPVRIPLAPLYEVAEREMPLQAGNWREWTDAYGAKVRYQAWRGPLSISMQGDELLIQAHVRYWLQARKSLMGPMTLKSSCGLQEPPRQAIVGVRIRLDWGPDWTLWPQFQVMPTRFLDQCEMSFANIDVTPLAGREFQRQLRERLYSAFRELSPTLLGVRYRAEQNWLTLQQPVELWKDHWLLLNPQAAAISPLTGQGNWVDARLALQMAPQIITGPRPDPQLWQLPRLMQIYPQPTGLNLRLAVDMSYEALSQSMTEELAGDVFEIKGHQATVETVSLSGQGREVLASVRLGGEPAGDVVIRAHVNFRPESQRFELGELHYDATLEDALLEADARLFYNPVRSALEDAANERLQQQMAQWKERLLGVFGRIMPDDMQLDVTALRFEDVQLNMGQDNIQLDGLASGHVALTFVDAVE